MRWRPVRTTFLTGARVAETVAEAIGDCSFIAGTTSRPRSYHWEFTTARDVAARIVGLGDVNRAALLFGSERYGLANEDLQYCNVLVRIPANPDYCSLNLAMSVQLLAYEIFMAREQPQSRMQLELPLAPSSDVEHFYAHLHQVLNEIDFDDRTGHLMERLRRLFNRAQLDRNELNIMRGILSAVQGRRGQSVRVRAMSRARHEQSELRLLGLCGDHAGGAAGRRAHGGVPRGATASFGNPGSTSHAYGEAASERVEAARAEVAATVGAQPAEVVWTSGATEANNLAIFGVAQYNAQIGRHIVTVRTEHKAVLDPCRELERRGWRVTYLTPDASGVLDPAAVAAALRPDTVLVSVMHVNNEIGVIQDIAAIAALCARSGSARLHVDAAQSIGKCAVNFSEFGIDLLSLSAHKAYGPKGVGALVVSRARGRAIETAAIWRWAGAGFALGHRGDPSGGRHGRGVRTRQAPRPRMRSGASRD